MFTRTLLAGLVALCSSVSALNTDPPKFELAFSANVILDVPNYNMMQTPEGTRTSIKFNGGNLTDPSGALIANIIPDNGAENGFIGNDGVYHPDVRFTVQFVKDKKFGYVQFSGYGKVGGDNHVISTIETDSKDWTHLNSKPYYGLLQFSSESTVYVPHWLPL